MVPTHLIYRVIAWLHFQTPIVCSIDSASNSSLSWNVWLSLIFRESQSGGAPPIHSGWARAPFHSPALHSASAVWFSWYPAPAGALSTRMPLAWAALFLQTPELLIHTARPAPRCGAFFLSPASRTSILACSLQPGDERLVLKSVRVEPVIIQTQANRLPLGRTALLVNQASGKWVVCTWGPLCRDQVPVKMSECEWKNKTKRRSSLLFRSAAGGPRQGFI